MLLAFVPFAIAIGKKRLQCSWCADSYSAVDARIKIHLFKNFGG